MIHNILCKNFKQHKINHPFYFLGIKMMYHHYKSTKEEEINEIRAKLYGEDFDHNSRQNEPI